jgi:Zn-dependent protease with chaperone function
LSIAFCLLFYSLAVVVLGPPLLARLTRTGHAPRLGVAAWLTAIGSVLLTWVAAAVLVIVEAAGHWNYPGVLLASCLARLRGLVTGDAGITAQITLLVLAAAAALATAVTSVRVARTLMRMRARAHDHAHAVRLVGHRTGAHDVVIVDAAEPATYCVSGRPPAIVVTSAALAALDDRQLAAILAHERAHLAGHHAIVVAALRSLAKVLPSLTLMTEGAAQVSRLLEMCADDAAAGRHGCGPLLSGLITLCGGAPPEALAAADAAVLARAERLTAPREHQATARARAALTSTVTVLAAGPVITAALAASGALMCGA